MRNIILIAIVLVVAAVLGFIWWHYVPARDGQYTVGNNRLAWHLDISNGVLRTRRVVNRTTGETLDIDDSASDFVLRVGPTTDVGWVTVRRRGQPDTFVHAVRHGWMVDPGACRVRWYVRGNGTRTFVLQHTNAPLTVKLEFSYRNGEPWLRRRISLQADSPTELAVDRADHLRWVVDGTAMHGGRGQPVFMNDTWFCGLEHPNSSNLASGSDVTLRQFPGYAFGHTPLALQSLVIGGGDPGTARATFDRYLDSIRRPPRSLTLFNTWCHLRDNELTAAAVRATAAQIKAQMAPYDTMFDAYVIDDGWQNKQSIWQARKDRFPNGLPPVFGALRTMGYLPGLWLSLSGTMLDNRWCEQHGYETANQSHLCFSGTNYQATLRPRLAELIDGAGLGFFKHDFNYFFCTRIQHGHYSTRMQSSEANIDALFDLLAFETQRNANIELAVTTGTWPSPWWLPHCDIIWMGGKDHDFDTHLPTSRGSTFEMNYRDGALYAMLVEKAQCFPLEALMTHGIVDARHNVYQMSTEDDEGWANYLMNYLGRGTYLREFYISPELLSTQRWEMVARGVRWAKSCDGPMLNAHFILGDPRAGELFGFAGTADGHGYCSLRNPGLAPATVTLPQVLPEADLYEVVYPWHEIRRWDNADGLTVPGEGVLIAESYAQQQLDLPSIVGARARLVRSARGETEYEVAVRGGEQQFEVVSPVAIKGIEGDTASVERQSATHWQVSAQGGQDSGIVCEVLDTDVSDGGRMRAMLVLRPGCTGTLRVLWRNTGTSTPRLTLNGKPITAAQQRGPGWLLQSIVLQPGTNNMATQLRGSAQSLTNVIVAAYLQARAPLAKRRIRIRHGRVTPRSIYARPLPILQAQLPSGAEILAPRPVDLRTRADLPESERLVSREQLQHVRSAVLKLDVFDANGGMFADKWMLLNGVRIGRLPANPEPLSSWHVCRINLPREALEKLTLDNVFGLKDETGDAYKIRVRQLTVTLDDGRAVSTPEDASVFSSSMEWPLAEGERLHRDGRTVTVLSF